MDKIKIVTNEIMGELIETVLIDHGNNEFTSMLKSTYEAQQVEHLTEIVPADE
jgi:hypothetical protein